MNKTELVNFIAEEAGVKKVVASEVLDAVLKGLSSSLVKGETVTLVGFGSFAVRKRAARKGRNPKTGTEIKIPSSVVPIFRPGTKLKEDVKKAKIK